MKYERLYSLTKERGGMTVKVSDYPDSIVIPLKGYAVGAISGTFSLADESDFDSAIDTTIKMCGTLGAEYLGTWVDPDGRIHIDPVHVFASRDYAMGYAAANNQEAIYDLFNSKEIWRK
jgi:hypothetical protein